MVEEALEVREVEEIELVLVEELGPDFPEDAHIKFEGVFPSSLHDETILSGDFSLVGLSLEETHKGEDDNDFFDDSLEYPDSHDSLEVVESRVELRVLDFADFVVGLFQGFREQDLSLALDYYEEFIGGFLVEKEDLSLVVKFVSQIFADLVMQVDLHVRLRLVDRLEIVEVFSGSY